MYEATNESLQAEHFEAMKSTLLDTDAEVDAALLTEEGLVLEEVDERMRFIEGRARAESHLSPPHKEESIPASAV